MSEYVIEKKTPLFKVILSNLNDFINSLSKEVTLEFIVPTNIVKRSELICMYLSEESGVDINIYDLIMILYKDFIKNSTLRYDTKKLFKDLTRTYDYEDVIKISYGEEEVYAFSKSKYSRKKIELTISKDNAMKGQLLLDELYDLYKHNITLSKLICRIWINFIEDYKRGEKNRELKRLINRLSELND